MSKNPKDRDDRNKGRNDNYDRRIIVDPPSDEQKKQPEEAVSSRKTFGIHGEGIGLRLRQRILHNPFTGDYGNRNLCGSELTASAHHCKKTK